MSTNVIYASEKANLSFNRGSPMSPCIKGFPIIISNNSTHWETLDYLLYQYTVKKQALGTVVADAFSLSLFLRYLNIKKVDIYEMNDDLLVGYRDFLLLDHKKGEASQINKHLRNAIKFLVWLENHYLKPNPKRAKIIAFSTLEKFIPAKISVDIDKTKRSNKFHHEAFLQPSIPKLRKPIPTDALTKIWGAIPNVCVSIERQLRDEITLNLLEFLGARRS